MKTTILTCLIAGLCGAAVRVLMRPEGCWRRWLAQFIVGGFCAVFLGSFLGSRIVHHLKIEDHDTAFYAIAATAFIVGTAGEEVIRLMQVKYIGKKED